MPRSELLTTPQVRSSVLGGRGGLGPRNRHSEPTMLELARGGLCGPSGGSALPARGVKTPLCCGTPIPGPAPLPLLRAVPARVFSHRV